MRTGRILCPYNQTAYGSIGYNLGLCFGDEFAFNICTLHKINLTTIFWFFVLFFLYLTRNVFPPAIFAVLHGKNMLYTLAGKSLQYFLSMICLVFCAQVTCDCQITRSFQTVSPL